MKKFNHWQPEEDRLLLQLYEQSNCFQKWKFVSENLSKLGFFKTEIQCRERFVNKLNPKLKKDKVTADQLRSIFHYYDQYGAHWSVFESLISGRSQSCLKNKFYSTLRSLVRIILSCCSEEVLEKDRICSTSICSKILAKEVKDRNMLGFRKFKGFLLSILKKANFQLDYNKISSLKNNPMIELSKVIRTEVFNSTKFKQGNQYFAGENRKNYKKQSSQLTLKEMPKEQYLEQNGKEQKEQKSNKENGNQNTGLTTQMNQHVFFGLPHSYYPSANFVFIYWDNTKSGTYDNLQQRE